MKNEYVIYWRQEALYRTKIIASSEAEALEAFNAIDDYTPHLYDDFDEFEPLQIDNVECIEEGVDNDWSRKNSCTNKVKQCYNSPV